MHTRKVEIFIFLFVCACAKSDFDEREAATHVPSQPKSGYFLATSDHLFVSELSTEWYVETNDTITPVTPSVSLDFAWFQIGKSIFNDAVELDNLDNDDAAIFVVASVDFAQFETSVSTLALAPILFDLQRYSHDKIAPPAIVAVPFGLGFVYATSTSFYALGSISSCDPLKPGLAQLCTADSPWIAEVKGELFFSRGHARYFISGRCISSAPN